MSHHDSSKKFLNTLLEQFKEINIQLQNNVSEFSTQIKQRAMKWIDNPLDTNMTYKDTVLMVKTAHVTLVELMEKITECNSTFVATNQKTTLENQDRKQSSKENQTMVSTPVVCGSNMERRLNQIESTLNFLQDTNQTTEDEIIEIKKWREKFVNEQTELHIKMEQLSNKQKTKFITFRNQINQQQKKVDEEIKSLIEKGSDSNSTLEKLATDIKETENNLLKIKQEMQDHNNTTDKEIKKQSDLKSGFHQDVKNELLITRKKLDAVVVKQGVMCNLLQQKLVPIDKLLHKFNQSIGSKGRNLQKLQAIENNVSKLSKDINKIDTRVFKRYACHVTLYHNTPVSAGNIISKFRNVEEYNDQHFNKTTGKLKSPYNGLFLVCFNLQEETNTRIHVVVYAGDTGYKDIVVTSTNTSAAGSVVVEMQKGQELYFKVYRADVGAAFTDASSFTVCGL